MKRAVWALVVAVPAIALLGTGFNRDPNAIVSPLVRHAAPSFSLRTLDDQSLALTRFRGRPVVLNFWAPWRTGCKIEHPHLVDAWHKYHPQGVVFIGVVYNDTRSDAATFMRQYGGGWPNVLDPGQRTAIDYGVPETFFIDRQGIIQCKSTGTVTPALLRLEIEDLLHR